MAATDKIDDNGNAKIQCQICRLWYHRLDVHLSTQHATKVVDYNAKFPGFLTISAYASAKASKGQAKKKKGAKKAIKAKPARPAADKRQESEPGEDAHRSIPFGCVKLPMRRDLDARDQAQVPQHDTGWEMGVNEKRQMEEVALGIEGGDNIMITGPAGIGKSTMVLEMAAILNQPVARIAMDGDMRRSDFVGDKNVVVDEKSGQAVTDWVNGVLVTAAERGWWLMIDEIDAMPAHIAFVMHGVLEGNRSLALLGDGGRLVKFHPDFRVVTTSNTLGRGDESGMFAGTNIMNEALLDRFGVVIAAGYPSAATEVDILVKRTGINVTDAGKMRKVAEKVREANKLEKCFVSLSTRRLIDWADKARRLKDPRRAAKITLVNKLGGDDAKFVDNVIQRYFGGDVS
jgi:cobaltochelatase CobS